MALIAKALGGIGNAVLGAGGSLLKTGARAFGDDAVKAVGRGVGKAQSGLDDVVKRAVKQDDLYKAAKNQARGLDTPQSATKPVANYRNNTSFRHDGASYRIQDGAYQRKSSGGNWEDITSKEYGHSRADFIGANEALEQAATNAESGAAAWSGVDNFVHEHPYIAAGIATGAGVAIAGLFDDDDD